MAAVTASTTAQALPPGWVDVQNLGAVDVYFDYDPGVSSSTGIKITPNGVYTRPWSNLFGMLGYVRAASGTADLRVTVAG
ncbi:hypothetical protein [Nakamurella sp.]|uniref:hypothetical protein n=1 Tax=Nakamurella sp. TaxID=1869182 RepID=UPI003782E0C0